VEKSLLYGEKLPYNSCAKNIFHFSKKYLDILYNFIDNTDMYYGGKSGNGVYHTIILTKYILNLSWEAEGS
jgi:hypothetical protein